MKLATLTDGSRDGQLVVVSRDLSLAVHATAVTSRLQAVLDDWDFFAPQLEDLYQTLNEGRARHAFAFDPKQAMAPLPRAYQWADGSSYVNHIELVRKARGAEMPPSFWTDPLMYQGGSDDLLGPHDDIVCPSEEHGIDFEAEVAVVTGDVPMGSKPKAIGAHIRLLMLVNDVSLRNLIPAELAKGFGFFQSKPATAFSPGRDHARRARRCMARRQSSSAADGALERRKGWRAERGRRHDVQFLAADRARRENAQRARRIDHRLGHRIKCRPQPRLLLHR